MLNLLLFIIAWILIPPLTVWNLIIVNRKYGNTKGYFRSTALSIDIWANREFRTLWNDKLKIDRGYEFGKENETISSALGKNERDKTLSKKGKGKLSSWFYGERLVKILNKLDKDHCKNAIDLTKGDWRQKQS